MDGETVTAFDPTCDHIQGIYSLQLEFFCYCCPSSNASLLTGLKRITNNCLETGTEQGKDSTGMHCVLSDRQQYSS